MKTYHMTGLCHIDLAWLDDERRYADYLEQMTVVMLDLLERNPEMTYIIEQAYHYRGLKSRRPDLIERLRQLINEGRIEVMGGLCSSADSNMPHPESLIRNLLLGRAWFQEELGAVPVTGWLFDAFGSHAQVPQILAAFGMREMISSRFGGRKEYDLFRIAGLDGTELTVAGRDLFSPNLPDETQSRIFMDFALQPDQIRAMFQHAGKTELDGPIFVCVYQESDIYPSRCILESARSLMTEADADGDLARFALPRDFFQALQETALELPLESADLNPEFTGTYSQRIDLKLQNRRTEVKMLDAEKWLALFGMPMDPCIRQGWWDMAFVHFHDVFTGSHPDHVFRDAMARLERNTILAEKATYHILGDPANSIAEKITLCNSLPFPRTEWVRIPRGMDAAWNVTGPEGPVEAISTPGWVEFPASVGACAGAVYTIKAAVDQPTSSHETTPLKIQNEYLQLTLDRKDGVTLHCANGQHILERVRDLLVLQDEHGNFQYESIDGSEQPAWRHLSALRRVGSHTLEAYGAYDEATWVIRFTLRPGESMIRLNIHTEWSAEGKRLRLKIPTELEHVADGIYEVPFGVISRKAYIPAANRKGEWPAQRFAAIENNALGVALINTGVPGVEILGGTIYTTLLRSPTASYAGMDPDDSSSQHGSHDFAFGLMIYPGDWRSSDLLQTAQAMNHPLTPHAGARGFSSLLEIDSPDVALTCVKCPEDNSLPGFFLRLTQSTGLRSCCTVTIPGLKHARLAGLDETLGQMLRTEDDRMTLALDPWKIVTIYVEREETP